jgi:hypothetical protein
MLNPLTAWTPGLLVTYHGSLTNLHGVYEAHPCLCLGCVDGRGLPGVRFELRDETGDPVVTCVRPRSITPAEEDEPQHEECLGVHGGAGGYRDCDGNPI